VKPVLSARGTRRLRRACAWNKFLGRMARVVCKNTFLHCQPYGSARIRCSSEPSRRMLAGKVDDAKLLQLLRLGAIFAKRSGQKSLAALQVRREDDLRAAPGADISAAGGVDDGGSLESEDGPGCNDHVSWGTASTEATRASTSMGLSMMCAEASSGAGLTTRRARCGLPHMRGERGLSLASDVHATGRCKPCAWHWESKGCRSGSDCGFCHHQDHDGIGRRRHRMCKAKRARLKRIAGLVAG